MVSSSPASLTSSRQLNGIDSFSPANADVAIRVGAITLSAPRLERERGGADARFLLLWSEFDDPAIELPSRLTFGRAMVEIRKPESRKGRVKR